MDYIQVTFRTDRCETYTADLLAAELADIGFESFEETNRGTVGYCPASVFSKQAMIEVIRNLEIADPTQITFRIDEIPDQNWNTVWEQNSYEPIVVDDQCCIHASNHNITHHYPYDIIINPVQSFGTGYHQTTRMMLRWLLNHDLQGKTVLDMGCGTAVLGILAAKRGAAAITAIDIDQWAWQNAQTNCTTNRIDNATILLGDASLLKDSPHTLHYDIVLANINRNILVADMQQYAETMKPGATLLTSGYYTQDLPIITKAAEKADLYPVSHTKDQEWCAAEFRKKA